MSKDQISLYKFVMFWYFGHKAFLNLRYVAGISYSYGEIFENLQPGDFRALLSQIGARVGRLPSALKSAGWTMKSFLSSRPEFEFQGSAGANHWVALARSRLPDLDEVPARALGQN